MLRRRLAVAGVAGLVVAGDLNSYYDTATASNGATAKSPPKLLKDWGMTDARPYQSTEPNCSTNATCSPYGTMNVYGGKNRVYDYIFTYYSSSVPVLVGTFQTVADGTYISDHKMIAARVKFP